MSIPIPNLRNTYIQEYSNLDKAIVITEDIRQCKAVMKALKDAFSYRDLEGGYKAALTHPLYLDAEAKVAELEEELTLLI